MAKEKDGRTKTKYNSDNIKMRICHIFRLSILKASYMTIREKRITMR